MISSKKGMSRLSRAATETWDYQEFDVHECTEEEVPKTILDNSHLHVCLPREMLKFKNNFDSANEKSAAFRVRPNYDMVKNKDDEENKNDKDAVNKECENFSMGRS